MIYERLDGDIADAYSLNPYWELRFVPWYDKLRACYDELSRLEEHEHINLGVF